MNNLIRALGTLILLLLPTCGVWAKDAAQADSLAFRIVDVRSREALAGVTCRAFTAEGKFHAYGISSNDGLLVVKVYKDDVMEFSSLGYSRLRVKAQNFRHGTTNTVTLSE